MPDIDYEAEYFELKAEHETLLRLATLVGKHWAACQPIGHPCMECSRCKLREYLADLGELL
jgi:hypothetical protein